MAGLLGVGWEIGWSSWGSLVKRCRLVRVRVLREKRLEAIQRLEALVVIAQPGGPGQRPFMHGMAFIAGVADDPRAVLLERLRLDDRRPAPARFAQHAVDRGVVREMCQAHDL